MAERRERPDPGGGDAAPVAAPRSVAGFVAGGERYVDRLIREAREQGAFDGLSCAGKPLPLTGFLEEAWWIKEKLKRERLSDLPEALAIRGEAERTLADLPREADEGRVRERLEALNARIRKINRTTVAGPPTTLAPVDVEEAVRRWRAAREGGGVPAPAAAPGR